MTNQSRLKLLFQYMTKMKGINRDICPLDYLHIFSFSYEMLGMFFSFIFPTVKEFVDWTIIDMDSVLTLNNGQNCRRKDQTAPRIILMLVCTICQTIGNSSTHCRIVQWLCSVFV